MSQHSGRVPFSVAMGIALGLSLLLVEAGYQRNLAEDSLKTFRHHLGIQYGYAEHYEQILKQCANGRGFTLWANGNQEFITVQCQVIKTNVWNSKKLPKKS